MAGPRRGPRPAARPDRDPCARRGGSARPARPRRPLRPGGRRGDRAARRARRRGRALPAVERAPRLRRRTAHGDARSRNPGLHRDGQPRIDAVVRHVRRDARRDRRGTGARAPPRRADRRRRARARHARGRSRARPRSRDRLARARKAGRSDDRLAGREPVRPLGRSCYGGGSRRLARSRPRYSRVRRDSI